MALFLQGVGGVGDQLADEDLLLRVERVDDDIEQLLDLGLEFEGLGGGGGRGHVIKGMVSLCRTGQKSTPEREDPWGLHPLRESVSICSVQ